MKISIIKKFIMLFIILQVSFLFSYTYVNSAGIMGYGDIVNSISSRAAAMGSVNITAGGMDGFLNNPASLDTFDKITISGTFRTLPVMEVVFTPDSSSSSEDKIIYNNSSFNLDGSFGVVLPFSLKKEKIKIFVGLSGYPVINGSYKYDYNIWNNYLPSQLIGYVKIQKIDYLFSTALAAGIKIVITEKLSISAGGEFGALLGGGKTLAERDLSVDNINTSLTNQYSLFKYGFNWAAGLKLGLPLDFHIGIFGKGFTKLTSKQLDSNYTGAFIEEALYPITAGLGIDKEFPEFFNTIVEIDFSISPWSMFKVRWSTDTTTFAKVDTMSEIMANYGYDFGDLNMVFKIGVEHIFEFKKLSIPLRYGFFYEPFYGDKNIDTAYFSVGSGIIIKNISIDFTLIHGRRNYRGDGVIYSTEQRITEYVNNIMLSVSASF